MSQDDNNLGVDLREYLEKVIDMKFGAMEEALRLARVDVDRRLAELNQLRSEVTQDRGQFVLKDIHYTWKETVEKRLSAIETRAITWTAAIGLFFVVVGLVMKFWTTK